MHSPPRPYRALAPLRAAGVLALVAAGAGGAALVAWLMHRIGALADTFAVGALVRGALLGALLSRVVHRAQVGRPRVAAAVALAAALLCAAGELALDYGDFRDEQRARALELMELRSAMGVGPPELAAEAERELSSVTLSQYVDERYGSKSASFLGSILGKELAVAVFFLEVGLIALSAVLLTLGRAREPCCSQCGRWLAECPLPAARHGIASAVERSLLEDNRKEALSHLEPPDTREETRFALASCPLHEGEIVLRLRELRFDRQRRRLDQRHLCDLQVSEADARALLAALEERVAAS